MAFFLKLEGIEGESKDKDHKNWTDVASVSFGVDMAGGSAAGQTRRRGAATVHPVTLSREYDKASPKLEEAVLSGKIFPKVEIHNTATFGESKCAYCKIELKDVKITSYHFSGSSHGDAVPTESLSLNFGEKKHTYTEYDNKGTKKGNVEMTWKVEEATK
jgi:type VI secretion system secreted protein Hcp